MAGSEQQQRAVEVMKSLNKAVTSLRLYPEQSAQVMNATEGAYADLKAYLRFYQILDFKLHKGVPTLDGVIFDRKCREQLDALSLVDALDKMGLPAMVLAQGIDRKKLRLIISFFTATPEQIQRSGGAVGLVEKYGLEAVFLEKEKEDSLQNQKVVFSFSEYLSQLISSGVRKEDFLLFLQTTFEQPKRGARIEGTDKDAKVLAAGVCHSLLAIQDGELFQRSGLFFNLMRNLQSVVDENDALVLVKKLSFLLATNLTEEALALLLAQQYEEPFGQLLHMQLVAAMEKESFRRVIELLRREEEKNGDPLMPEEEISLQLLRETSKRLMSTAKGRQLHAQELMGITEIQRQGKRLQAGLNALARGSLDGLRNKEIVLHLPATFERLLQNKKESIAAAILQTLVSGLKLSDEELQERAAHCLSSLGEKLIVQGYWDWLEKLTPTYLLWLRKTDGVDETIVSLIKVLQKILTHAQSAGHEDVVDTILPFFYAVRSGSLVKKSGFRDQVALVQDQSVDPRVLQDYLDRCFVKPREEMFCQRIVMHGPVGIRFLLDTLLVNTKRPERIRLLKILSGAGAMLSVLLRSRLQEPMPWFGKRNLLRLLAATGNEDDVAGLHRYFTHEDLRVQQEALSCLCRLAGAKKKQHLLRALPQVSEKIKFQVVEALSSVVDEEVVGVLGELLQDEKYFSADVKKNLLISLFNTLGVSGSQQAQKILLQFAGGGDRSKGASDEVWQALQRALSVLEAHRRQIRQKAADVQKVTRERLRKVTSSTTTGADVKYTPVTNLAEEEEVYLLLSQNRKSAAKKILMELISTVTCLRLLEQAEVLCQRLAEIDPQALDDILKAREWIEEQKGRMAEQGPVMSWVEVYDFLTTSEFNGLYSVMERVTYGQDENIVSQGELRPQLFFLNKGRVKLFCKDPQGNDILLRILGPGDVFGADSFFRSTVWTVNAASVGSVDLFVLSREALKKLLTGLPDLESKLKEFCQQFTAQEAVKVIAVERRMQGRLDFSGRLVVSLLDEQGQPSGTVLQGENGNISQGGMNGSVRGGLKKTSRMLLGRKVLVSLPGNSVHSLSAGVPGFVVAVFSVGDGVGSDLSGSSGCFVLHIQFDQPLAEDELKLAAQLCPLMN